MVKVKAMGWDSATAMEMGLGSVMDLEKGLAKEKAMD